MLPSNSIQLKIIKKGISPTDNEFENPISSSVKTTNQIYYLIKIKPEEANPLLLNNSNDRIISDRSNIKNEYGINLNQPFTSIIKHEVVDIKPETIITSDITPATPDFETSFISVKDESYDNLSSSKDDTLQAYSTESQTSHDSISSTDSLSEGTLKHYCEKVDAKIKKHICDSCNKGFFLESDLKNHKCGVDLNKGDLKCDQCEKFYNTPYSLKRHQKQVHLKMGKWSCTQCERSFGMFIDLLKHKRRIHLNIKDWKCVQCEKSFFDQSNLKSHERSVHLKIRKWKCVQCEKSFTNRGDLNRHERGVHLKRRDWKCVQCNKSFFGKYYLKEHERAIHLNIKDFKCPICDKIFSSMGSLKRHERTVHLDPLKLTDEK